MRKILVWVIGVVLACCGCTPSIPSPTELATEVNGKERLAARDATAWGLRQCDRVGHSLAVGTADVLSIGAVKGIAYLQGDGAKQLAGKVNEYLTDLVIVALPPGATIAIDAAATILDRVGVDPAALLTQAELDTLTAFLQGISDGVALWRAGKAPDTQPAATRAIGAPRWFAVRNMGTRAMPLMDVLPR